MFYLWYGHGFKNVGAKHVST